jgi:hypothetical protein
VCSSLPDEYWDNLTKRRKRGKKVNNVNTDSVDIDMDPVHEVEREENELVNQEHALGSGDVPVGSGLSLEPDLKELGSGVKPFPNTMRLMDEKGQVFYVVEGKVLKPLSQSEGALGLASEQPSGFGSLPRQGVGQVATQDAARL